jgi:thiol-disulfide isomerase/thioredoxin
MKLSQDKMRALILLGIVLACAAAFQIFRMREGMENDSFTGIRFFTIENCGHCKALKPTIERLQANHGAHVKLHDGTNPDAETEQLMKQYDVGRFADGLTGRLGCIPSAFGHGLGTLGGCGNGIAGFLDGGLHVFLGLITGRQTESGRCHNEEIRFHSSAKVKNEVGRGNHIFAETAEEPLNTEMPRPGLGRWLLR